MFCRLACCLLLFCLAPSWADSSQDIRAAYVQLDAAYSRRDVPAVAAMLAPGFARRGWNSTLTSAQYGAELTDSFDGTASVTAVTKIQSLIVQGDTAEVLVSRRINLTFPEPLPE